MVMPARLQKEVQCLNLGLGGGAAPRTWWLQAGVVAGLAAGGR
jgi:hypothetical protein